MSNTQSFVPERFRQALQRLNGDSSLLQAMAKINAEDLPEIINQTDRSISEGDCSNAASNLHKLKGMLSTFETDGVVLEIQEMLDQARAGEEQELRSSYRQHRPAVDELIQQIERLANE